LDLVVRAIRAAPAVRDNPVDLRALAGLVVLAQARLGREAGGQPVLTPLDLGGGHGLVVQTLTTPAVVRLRLRLEHAGVAALTQQRVVVLVPDVRDRDLLARFHALLTSGEIHRPDDPIVLVVVPAPLAGPLLAVRAVLRAPVDVPVQRDLVLEA